MKVYNYVVISLTMMIVLTFLGFNTGGFTQLLNLVGFSYTPTTGEIGNVTTSASGFFHQLFGNGTNISGILYALVVAGGSVIVGLFTKTDTENLILLPFITGTLVLFVECFVSIMNLAIGTFPTWASAVVLTIFIPFTIGFILSLAEFFRGSD